MLGLGLSLVKAGARRIISVAQTLWSQITDNWESESRNWENIS